MAKSVGLRLEHRSDAFNRLVISPGHGFKEGDIVSVKFDSRQRLCDLDFAEYSALKQKGGDLKGSQ